MQLENLNFDKGNGLLPAIIQDAATGKVLMLGYMNRQALQRTRDERVVTFYSRGKERLWTKGETSGHYLHVVDLKADCDRDALLIKANPQGPVCHTGSDTCFDESNTNGDFLEHLEQVIQNRRDHPREGSYTSRLFTEGLNKIAQKVGEEAVELIIEAKDDNKERFLNEAADLVYHLLVLLAAKGYRLEEVTGVLEGRHR